MSDNTNLMKKYDAEFTEIGYVGSNEVDVKLICDCDEEIYIYVPDAIWRCKKCGRVYRVKTILEIGKEIIKDNNDDRIYYEKDEIYIY